MKALAVAFIIIVLVGIAYARPSLVPTDIAGIKEAVKEGKVTVLVSVQDTPSISPVRRILATSALRRDMPAEFRELRKHNKAVREGVLNKLRSKNLITGNAVIGTGSNVEVVHEFDSSTGFSATVDAAGVDALANTPGVTSIRISPQLPLALRDSIPLMKANAVWNRSVNGVNINGRGQTICVIDTGIDYTHPAFAGRIVNSYCYLPSASCPDPGNLSNANDDNGHGTHVAGIAAGNGTYVGVAPAASIIAIKACYANSACSLAAMAAGVDHCVGVASQYNVSAITLSISDGGHYATINDCPWDETFENAVNAAWAQGIVVSIAAGNNGTALEIGYPSCIPNATSVSATDKSDTIAGYAQVGNLLDLLATGSSITSAVPGGGYDVKSGTSMATPHIAGAAALLAQNERLSNRTTTTNQLEDIMKQYSSKRISGWPRIDVLEVLTARNTNMVVNASANSVATQGVASVAFTDSTDMTETDSCITLGQNIIEINTTRCPQFNKNATLSLSNLTYSSTPIPLVNGTVCTDCGVGAYVAGVLTFNVSHFSSYSSGPNAALNISDDTDTLTRVPYQTVAFTANHSNRTSGAAVNGSCSLRLNTTGAYGAAQPMTYTAGVYRFNSTFTTAGNLTYAVNCSAASFESLNATDALTITPDATPPTVTLVAPGNGTTLTQSNSVRLNYSVTDNSDGLANCTLLINGSANTTTASPQTSTPNTFNVTLHNGSYGWGVQCTDNSNNANTSGTYVLAVDVGNGAPVLGANMSNYTFDEDTNTTVNVSAYFSDPNGDPLSFTSVNNASLSVTIDGSGNASVSAAADVAGTFSLAFIATDAIGASTQGNTVTITVTPVNDAPSLSGSISDKSWTMGSSRVSAFDLDDYFTDVDNASLIYTSNGTSQVTVTIDATRHNVSFTSPSTWSGTEHVTFRASDGQYTTLSNTLTLTVSTASSSSSGGGGGGSSCTSQCQSAGPLGCSGGNRAIGCSDTNGDGCLELTVTQCTTSEACVNSSCVGVPCTPQWSCTPWTPCSGSVQTRGCIDAAQCANPGVRPVERQSCVVQAVEETPARPAVAAPPAATMENASGNVSNNITGAAVCGDGMCSLTEWCMADCKSRNYKAPVVVVLSGAVILVLFNHLKRVRVART